MLSVAGSYEGYVRWHVSIANEFFKKLLMMSKWQVGLLREALAKICAQVRTQN